MNSIPSVSRLLLILTTSTLLATSLASCSKTATPTEKTTENKEEAAPTDTVELKAGAEKIAGIQVETMVPRTLARTIAASGEVKANDYRSAQITPRIAAQVVRRLVKLGDIVKAGQPLVTLNSVEVAEAQGELQVKSREWERVRDLGEAIVGGRRYLEAQVAAEQARAKLIAYGLSPVEAHKTQTLGQFTLVAPRAGTVMRDDFVEGERIEAGRALFLISDESASWVEANVSPADASRVAQGSKALVKVDNRWLEGRVIQKHHLVDETTRTIPVRIEVMAADDHIHNGEFVECRLEVGRLDQAIAVPNAALYQGTDGSWAVFVQKSARHYQRIPVQVKEELGELTVVDGLAAGSVVVTTGAFYLNSELAKASFAEEE
ncbi:MAG: efflux RND transporter periplasmic adaptor subunit [Pseudomonadales bacterium]|nr:efflux RND transporter periplasmic adaptor subunit [Pseudomonadales bacterium]